MANWMNQMMPNEYVSSIYEIDLSKLWNSGKRLILTDLDNTLVPWNEGIAPEKLVNWLRTAQAFGFFVCILSNNKGQRVEDFSHVVGVPAISKARKPKPQAFKEALLKFRVKENEAVMIGDQLLTDIYGGNRSGLYTILVLPVHPDEWWGTKLNRKVERIFMKRLVKRGLAVPKNP